MRRRIPIVGHDLSRARESSPTGRVARAGLRAFACAVMALTAGCGGSPSGPSPPPPPTLTCPADISQAQSAPGQPTIVTYTPPTAANGAPPVTVSCAPGSGSAFGLGSTEVACTATDALSRSATCAFTVTVTEVPQVEKVEFLAFGDSVTEGTISSPCPAVEGVDTLWMKMAVVKPESYPYKLQQLLADRYTSQTITVVNEGRAGEKVAAGTDRLPRLLDSAEPEVLLLLHGFNDLLSAGRRDTFESEIPRIAGELEDMVKIGRSQKVTVLLATMPAMDASGCRGAGAPGVLQMNDAIRRVAADEGAVLVDLYQGLGASPAGVIGIDGLHPTEEGYTKMAQVWFDAIRREFERPSATGAAAPILLVPPFDRIR